MLILPLAVSAAEGVSITGDINVAQGKPVYAAVSAEGYKLTNGVYKEYLIPPSYGAKVDVELPTGDVVPGAASAADDWYIVDLGKRYAVKEVKLYPRGDGGYVANQWMTNFKLLASNDITFATENTTELGAIGADDAACGVTSETTPFVIKLDGSKAYQYIKLQKTAWSYYGYGELEVYAEETLEEVSRDKAVTGNYAKTGTWADVCNITDGVTDSDSDCWYVEWGWNKDPKEAIPYAVVDLGEDTPIDMIQMWTRRTIPEGAMPTSNWEVYGFEDGSDVTAEDFSPESGTKLLVPTSAEFPCNLAANDPKNYYEKGLDGTAYRYVVFQKTYYNVQLAEVRIFTAVPTANSAVLDGNKIIVGFSDVMKASTIADGLTVKIDGADAEDIDYEMTDESTLEIDLGKQYFDSQIKILLTDDIKNESGVGLKARNFTLHTPKALETDITWQNSKTGEGTVIESIADAVEAGEIGVKVSFVNNSSENEASSIVIAALYDSNNYIVAADEQRITVDALKDGSVTVGFDLPDEINADNAANYKLSVLLWKDFSLMKPWIPKVTLGE